MRRPSRTAGNGAFDLRVLGLPGSLRRDSYNAALLRAAADAAPHGLALRVFDTLQDVPLFSEDLEADPPAGVSRLRTAVAAADGLLIATPEYNHSIPGVLKNAIDWLSRSRPEDGLGDKPTAIVGATTGPWGTRLAQAHLRQILVSTGALVMPEPALYVADAASVFDAAGRVVDPGVVRRLEHHVASFASWIRLVSPAAGAFEHMRGRPMRPTNGLGSGVFRRE